MAKKELGGDVVVDEEETKPKRGFFGRKKKVEMPKVVEPLPKNENENEPDDIIEPGETKEEDKRVPLTDYVTSLVINLHNALHQIEPEEETNETPEQKQLRELEEQEAKLREAKAKLRAKAMK